MKTIDLGHTYHGIIQKIDHFYFYESLRNNHDLFTRETLSPLIRYNTLGFTAAWSMLYFEV